MGDEYWKLPRLYVAQSLKEGAGLALSAQNTHYFRTVLRRQAGDLFRVFNGRDGEFAAEITALGKREGAAVVARRVKAQPPAESAIHLLFAPLGKERMDILVEKAVELGADHLHPVLTERSNVRRINRERLQAQILEAAEQCERLTIPALHPLVDLSIKLKEWMGPSIYWCCERGTAPLIGSLKIAGSAAFLVGPAGGFSDLEMRDLERSDKIMPISLGKTIYRSETACIICLAAALLGRNQEP